VDATMRFGTGSLEVVIKYLANPRTGFLMNFK
jgi:hypothetical protein